jgi:glycosyltransferase involved in cell wall biosynthesis
MGTSPQRLDVLFLTHNFPRHPGDFSGRFLERLARLLLDRGVRVGVVVPHAPGAAEHEILSDIPVWRYRYADDANEVLAYRGQAVSPSISGPTGLWAHQRFFSAFKRLAKKVCRETQPRVIHSHWWLPGGWVGQSVVGKERFLVTCHGTDVRLLERKAWMRPMAARVFRRADLVTTVSSALAHSLERSAPACAAKLRIAPMPPEDSLFVGEPRLSMTEPPLILCVTRFTPQKRNDVLIRALAVLKSRGFQFNARLIGDGGTERDKVARMIGELGLSYRVEIESSMTQDKLAAEYRRADVTVLPAVDEGFGLTLVEAQLCGCPVIGANSGGITDIITDGQTGLLFAPDNAEELAAALQRLLSDHDLRRRLALSGQGSAQAKFSSRAIVDHFLEWYQLG